MVQYLPCLYIATLIERVPTMINETYDRQRVLNFTDAVFSIALTVLILDVTAPMFKDSDKVTLGSILGSRALRFVGYLVSFLVIGKFWQANVRNLKHVSIFDSRLLSWILGCLFFVVFLPFSTALYVGNFFSDAAFQWYAINVAIIGMMSNAMVKYIYNNHIQDGSMSRKHRQYYLLKGRSIIVIWLLLALCSFSIPFYISRFLFLLIFVRDFMIYRYWNKRLFS